MIPTQRHALKGSWKCEMAAWWQRVSRGNHNLTCMSTAYARFRLFAPARLRRASAPVNQPVRREIVAVRLDSQESPLRREYRGSTRSPRLHSRLRRPLPAGAKLCTTAIVSVAATLDPEPLIRLAVLLNLLKARCLGGAVEPALIQSNIGGFVFRVKGSSHPKCPIEDCD